MSYPVDVGANTIVLDESDPNIIYAGTDIGVWRSLNGGCRAPRQRDRALLLRQELGELRRTGHARLDRNTPLRVQRTIRERRQLGGVEVSMERESHAIQDPPPAALFPPARADARE